MGQASGDSQAQLGSVAFKRLTPHSSLLDSLVYSCYSGV